MAGLIVNRLWLYHAWRGPLKTTKPTRGAGRRATHVIVVGVVALLEHDTVVEDALRRGDDEDGRPAAQAADGARVRAVVVLGGRVHRQRTLQAVDQPKGQFTIVIDLNRLHSQLV